MTKELLLKAVSSGQTQRQVALAVGKSQTAIRYWLKKFKIKHRFKHEVYTKQHLQKVVSDSLSIADVLRGLNISISSASYRYVRKRINRDAIDTSHFLGQSKSGKHTRLTKEEIFSSTEDRLHAKYLRRALLESGVPYACNECGISTWHEKPLRLEVDHRDGNRRNHKKKNLRFMCPNCHSQTPTYGQTAHS